MCFVICLILYSPFSSQNQKIMTIGMKGMENNTIKVSHCFRFHVKSIYAAYLF